MKWKQALLGAAAMIGFLAASAHAQTLQLAIIGSSAQFLEEGQAETTTTTPGCWWTDGTKTDMEAEDTGLVAGGGSAVFDKVSWWIVWTAGTGSCSAPTGGYTVNLYANSDSVVGNRCFFRANADGSTGCIIDVLTACSTLASQGGSSLLGTGFPDASGLPTAVCGFINGSHFNTAATDIRPEDAKFAINRALATGGTQMFPGSQYIGLGYTNGSTISGSTLGGGSSFNVMNFNIVGDDPFNTTDSVPGFDVVTLGAVPELVFVNASDEAGFGNLAVTNLERGTLAGYLDGTNKATSDAIDTQVYSASGEVVPIVFIRENLSGTYNTMEYNVPNSEELQTSQDCGIEAYNALTANKLWESQSGEEGALATPPWECPGGVPANPIEAHSAGGTVAANTTVYRAIGTGNEVASVIANADSLGYAFWSAANFSGTSAADKYLTVDGIDPIFQNWVDGEIPTSSNGLLGNVSMAHVKDGSYPIWSYLRLVTTSANLTNATNLISAALNFLSPTQPDFVSTSQMYKIRSHFAPPGVAFPLCTAGYTPPVGVDGTGGVACSAGAVNNGTTSNGNPESGGDVGGMPFGLQSEGDYNHNNGVKTGHIGKRY
jgi:hypothetical protein